MSEKLSFVVTVTTDQQPAVRTDALQVLASVMDVDRESSEAEVRADMARLLRLWADRLEATA